MMKKTNSYFTASAASLTYFVTFIILKYLLHDKILDWKGALIGAIIFWAVIFIVHQILNRRSDDLD
ncbi:MAG: hypothetical protein MPEBLZ_03741 [Candidatus Methanoperedens nitroreducens]|uniref:Uncharacterized protein n=1 Tax=Candidatus Methanoperedens nitratireducens TaxID=1392998 RepID=A0A0P8C509_9EURY|nr:hypothetical protein [Candidatus Methanoperedens sp. BLZ2]KAB2944785.1 MAG: hypothetical protein F9K14_13130 [Candidatus Methanoperedens sp.]KPQ41713.1 MAG: hypothetical protein MPEBLZ_03741 [Candidatus Methanoperedens sp. BLZ1]MBZ0177074.1 hypothetical protein [Candidatus Methanoperedens nitroreducens]CAG0975617.1 hypothetical protein METP2_01653 [Methanosarcinales archaeon]MCX9077505.1 hypothetical protein [Candidatus Methanoperedens sp.]